MDVKWEENFKKEVVIILKLINIEVEGRGVIFYKNLLWDRYM